MGVYINMEMPKPGEVIRIYNNGEARRCHVTEQEAFEVGIAIPVPEPHGDLIDRRALLKGEGRYLISLCKEGIDVEEILRAKTVIPATEEGE